MGRGIVLPTTISGVKLFAPFGIFGDEKCLRMPFSNKL